MADPPDAPAPAAGLAPVSDAAPVASRASLVPRTPAYVQAIDHAGEIVAICLGAWLCSTGKISGELWMGFAAVVLGVQTGLRSTRGVSGVAGLLLAGKLTAGHLAASSAAAEIARRAHGGYTTPRALGLVAWLTLASVALPWLLLLSLGSGLAGCPRTLSPREGCRVGDTRCSPLRGIPQVCSSTQRWESAQELPCSGGQVCCPGHEVYTDAALHTCLPPTACVAADGGAL